MSSKLPNTFVVGPQLMRFVAQLYISPSQELDALARDWAKPPPDALFGLRVPIDYVHIQTAVRLNHQSCIYPRFSSICSALS